MFILETNKLKIEVQGNVLVEDVNLHVEAGERIGIIGRNGVGKTTLLEVLASKMAPSSGEITCHSNISYIPQIQTAANNLSGGEKTRKQIQAALRENSAVLFADEPTTNLDLASIKHLEKALIKYPGTILLISHDRAFLDNIATEIWEIEQTSIHIYKGNYSFYKEERARKNKQQEKDYAVYQAKKRQLQSASEHHDSIINKLNKPSKNLTAKEIRSTKPAKGVQEKKQHKTQKALEKRIDRLEKVAKPRKFKPVKIKTIAESELKRGNTILSVREHDVTAANKFLFRTPAFSIKAGSKVALVGENASGKTSFLREIVAPTSNIRIANAVKFAYFDQQLEKLAMDKTVAENINAVTAHDHKITMDVLGGLHFNYTDLAKTAFNLSGGERVKLLLAMLLVTDANFFILDEPTNYLDLEALEALEKMITAFNGTVLFVSHDRAFTEHVATSYLEIKQQKLTLFHSNEDRKRVLQPIRSRNNEDKLILEMRLSEIAAKLSVPGLTASQKAQLDKDYLENSYKLRNYID